MIVPPFFRAITFRLPFGFTYTIGETGGVVNAFCEKIYEISSRFVGFQTKFRLPSDSAQALVTSAELITKVRVLSCTKVGM